MASKDSGFEVKYSSEIDGFGGGACFSFSPVCPAALACAVVSQVWAVSALRPVAFRLTANLRRATPAA